MTRTRPPFLDWPGPIAFAHRGGGGERPENTMEAFVHAVEELGYCYLETDVHVSRDGVVFAIHDPCLERISDRSGRVDALTAVEIESADAGFHFTPDGGRSFPWRGRDLNVPRLETILDAWPAVRINLDLKSDAVVEPLLRLLQRMRAWDRVCVGSFSDRRIFRARQLAAGRLCTSMGPRAVAAARLAALTGRMPRLNADCIQVPLKWRGIPLADPRTVRAAHTTGLPLHVWTIDDEATMEALLDGGVDGIMTDRPTLLRQVLCRRRLWHEG